MSDVPMPFRSENRAIVPLFEGTRVPVESLINRLKDGESIDEFLEDHPSVMREQIHHVLDQAKAHLLGLS